MVSFAINRPFHAEAAPRWGGRGHRPWPCGAPDQPAPPRVADLVSALSYALDLTGGQAAGWAVRTCRIGMRLAAIMGLPADQQADLYYALLLKDTGCSSNAARVAQIFNGDDIAAKRAAKLLDWHGITWQGFRTTFRLADAGQSWHRRLARTAALGLHRRRDALEVVQLRCERGASIALKMGFSARTAEAIRHLDERWDGRGAPAGLRGEQIPVLARIVSVAQTLALFAGDPVAAMRMLRHRGGRWFDPALVRAAAQLRDDRVLWRQESLEESRRRVLDLDPGHLPAADAAGLDRVCEAFAEVIDAKSPYTCRHSREVAEAADCITGQLDLPPAARALVRRAALLHDIGKLGISNRILDKPGGLTREEWITMRQHPRYTGEILGRVPGWQPLAEAAASHHERLDGSGYHRGLRGAHLSIESRIVAVADVYAALSVVRPYRAALPQEAVFALLAAETPHALDADCVAALRAAQAATSCFKELA